ncbi:MAG: hypothetical protein U0412_13820 [Nitrospira sp.]
MATSAIHCGFCRRIVGERTETVPPESEQTHLLLSRSRSPIDAPWAEEVFCHECDQFYRQLLTFGRGESPAVDTPQPSRTT